MLRIFEYVQVQPKHAHFIPTDVTSVETMFRYIKKTRQRRKDLPNVPGIALYKKHLFGWLKTSFVHFDMEKALENGDLIQGGTKPFEWISFIDCAPLPPPPSPLSPQSTTSFHDLPDLSKLQVKIYIDNEDLTCPLTQDQFVEPVVASDGQTYERYAIEDWIKRGNGKARSPIFDDVVLESIVYSNNLMVKILLSNCKEN